MKCISTELERATKNIKKVEWVWQFVDCYGEDVPDTVNTFDSIDAAVDAAVDFFHAECRYNVLDYAVSAIKIWPIINGVIDRDNVTYKEIEYERYFDK